MRTALVREADGLIGRHLVKLLEAKGFRARDVDLEFHGHSKTERNDFATW